MIILDNVSKHYQTRDKTRFAAVEPTSLEIQDGEIFGLMGYSGAGKSTLLRLINLLERPDSGKVNVCGQELTALEVPRAIRLTGGARGTQNPREAFPPGADRAACGNRTHDLFITSESLCRLS